MQTDDLITLLAQAPPPRKPLSFSWVLLAFLAMITLFTVFALGLRADLTANSIKALHKMLLLGAVAWIAGLVLQNAAKPLARPRPLKAYGWLLGAFYAGSIGFELMTTPLTEIAASFYKINFPECLLFVTLYGALGSWLLRWLMGFYAPSDSKKAGMMIGLTAAATGAVGYSLHCPIDSPIFITVAYGLPVLLLSVVMRELAEQFIRW